MQHASHPDDERLAALAGGDPDVTGDATLSAHLAACDRCRTVVDEISLMRSALAELPDLVPSRPLQLLPPVADRPAAAAGWMRRLFAPLVATGAGLVLVGAVGSAGVFDVPRDQLRSAELQGGAGSQGVATYDNDKSVLPLVSDAASGPVPGSQETQPPPDAGSEYTQESMRSSASDASAVPSVEGGGESRGLVSSTEAPAGQDDLSAAGTDRSPWVVLLFAGAALTGGAFLLRGSPVRAG